MISCAVNDEGGCLHLPNSSAKVGKEIGADFRDDEFLAFFGAEDEMDEEV